MATFNHYLNFAGNAEEAFNFYKSIVGGKFTDIVRYKDMPMEGVDISPKESNKIMHIGLPLGNGQILMASDVIDSFGNPLVPGNNVYISVHPDSKAEADRLFAGLSEGGGVEMPIADQPWGDYYGSFADKFGVHWMINFNQEG